MIPDWTHGIINLPETEKLITGMTCNEIFDPNHPAFSLNRCERRTTMADYMVLIEVKL